jgi:hypothetical protein
LAFHGEAPSDGYEVNHKDTNKHNNRPGNLEWMTRGENLTHAYQEGLRKENRRVVVTDVTNGKIVEYFSMGELGRVMGVSKASVWTMITNHKTKPFRDRYTFEFIKGNVQIAKRASTKLVYAFDYRTRTLHAFDNLAELELTLGVKRGTVFYHLQRKSTALLKGFIFSYFDDDTKYPNYSQEQIEESMKKAVKI